MAKSIYDIADDIRSGIGFGDNAVRDAIGKKGKKKPKKAKSPKIDYQEAKRKGSKSYVNTSPDARKARMMRARQMNRDVKYDPLSSLASNSKIKKVAKKVRSRNSGLTVKQSRKRAKKIIKGRK